jgi:hypothetical protein
MVEAVFSSKPFVNFTGLHGVTFQKVILFIVIAVRTSDSTELN